MLALVSCFLATIATGLTVAAVATTCWYKVPVVSAEIGLFQGCSTFLGKKVCTGLLQVPDYIYATRAFVILGAIFLAFAIPLSLLQARGKLKSKGHVIIGGLLLIAAICLLIGCSVYTAKVKELTISDQQFGFSLWMAWSACAIAFVATPFAFLSKKSAYGHM